METLTQPSIGQPMETYFKGLLEALGGVLGAIGEVLGAIGGVLGAKPLKV
jgi:hypothetical protein